MIAVVNEQGEALSGSVCGTFAPVENDAPPGRVTAVHVSPDGRYRAETRMLGSEVQATHETLTVTDLATGRTVATVPYARSIYTRWAARGWLNSELYLIGQTLDQGVLLYVSLPEGRTGNLFPEVFGLDADEESYVWLVDGHADPATGEYHLLLQQYKDSPGSPLWLYHSELDRVEEVPFHFAWPFFDSSSFTPDGRWLLLGNPIDEGEPFPVNYWLRPVDPPGAAAVEITRDVALDGFSGEARITAEIVAEAVLHHWAFCGLTDQEQEIAFCTRDYVRILSLADGGLLGQWRTSPSHVRYLRWSPDGKRAVAMGCDEQTQKEALFVIQMP